MQKCISAIIIGYISFSIVVRFLPGHCYSVLSFLCFEARAWQGSTSLMLFPVVVCDVPHSTARSTNHCSLSVHGWVPLFCSNTDCNSCCGGRGRGEGGIGCSLPSTSTTLHYRRRSFFHGFLHRSTVVFLWMLSFRHYNISLVRHYLLRVLRKNRKETLVAPPCFLLPCFLSTYNTVYYRNSSTC